MPSNFKCKEEILILEMDRDYRFAVTGAFSVGPKAETEASPGSFRNRGKWIESRWIRNGEIQQEAEYWSSF